MLCASGVETGARAPLLRHGLLRAADGPLLCVGPELRRIVELQGAAVLRVFCGRLVAFAVAGASSHRATACLDALTPILCRLSCCS